MVIETDLIPTVSHALHHHYRTSRNTVIYPLICTLAGVFAGVFGTCVVWCGGLVLEGWWNCVAMENVRMAVSD